MTTNIHFNILKPSSLDTVELACAVEDRFLDLLASYLRVKGQPLAVPVELNADMLHWREMRVRHRQGELQNTEAELKSTRAIAQWTLDQNNLLRGQPKMTMEWRD